MWRFSQRKGITIPIMAIGLIVIIVIIILIVRIPSVILVIVIVVTMIGISRTVNSRYTVACLHGAHLELLWEKPDGGPTRMTGSGFRVP